jgi:LacI family transcriptional regulator
MGVTIKDIAKKTGLSITTISLVLNKRESRISEKTRQIIENAAQELRYTPNQAAVSLSTKKTNMVALAIPRGSFLYPADMVASVEKACRNAAYSLCLFLPEGDGDSCMEALQEILRRDADGIIFDPSCLSRDFFQTYMDMVSRSDSPICSLAGAGAHLLPNSIIPDHRQGGCLAASHLLELGHRRIGVIAGPKENTITAGFLRGLEDALEQWRLDPQSPPVLFGANTALAGYEGLDALLKSGGESREGAALTGIIAGSDAIAGGILRRAHELGIKVPEQLSVTGYGNSSPSAELYVPLTTVSIHYDRIARKAVNLIKKLNQSGPALTPELIAPSLVTRQSTTAV